MNDAKPMKCFLPFLLAHEIENIYFCNCNSESSVQNRNQNLLRFRTFRPWPHPGGGEAAALGVGPDGGRVGLPGEQVCFSCMIFCDIL